jgi:hypothetical protein
MVANPEGDPCDDPNHCRRGDGSHRVIVRTIDGKPEQPGHEYDKLLECVLQVAQIDP